ncbi:hypothetical protein GGR57DRAFT_503254 [Xylariaceae sp. FL1272]|nr:hypothetical protein GGR57DRAFT_503254 [Xylariaceae sp. FL1272]
MGQRAVDTDIKRQDVAVTVRYGSVSSRLKTTSVAVAHWERLARIAMSLLAIGLLAYQLCRLRAWFHPLTNSPNLLAINVKPEFTWSKIAPSRDLEWQSCYDGAFDCARLDLPMDWLDPTEEERVILPIIRLPATERDNYRGPVFFNPGGPGGSGVFAMKHRGAHLQTIIGRNHDIITFDPRGIGAAVPRAECWKRSEQSQLWELQDIGIVNAHPGIVYDIFARAAAFSRQCETQMMNESNLLHHISTASHARDMLEILNKLGHDKLKYWGFSYGTVLGGVFASLYPEKVERLVSDGNVDYEEWHHQNYINFLRDADKVMNAFFDFCHDAGPNSCDFYAEAPARIEERLQTLLKNIRARPVVVAPGEGLPGTGPDMPQLITWSHVRRLTSAALYRPILMFQQFASVLAALEAGDGRPFYNMMQLGGGAPPVCSVEGIPPDVPRLEEGNSDAFPAIMCADLPMLNDTVEDFVSFVEDLNDISRAVGDVNALFRLACIGRSVRSKWRYDGPFTGNTSFPILYIANMADNVSPLVSATNNSQGFPGSVVLVQNSYGHTSLSAASTCTAQHIRDYFQQGKLPKPGTSCEPDYLPFQDTSGQSGNEISVALHELSKANWGFLFP